MRTSTTAALVGAPPFGGAASLPDPKGKITRAHLRTWLAGCCRRSGNGVQYDAVALLPMSQLVACYTDAAPLAAYLRMSHDGATTLGMDEATKPRRHKVPPVKAGSPASDSDGGFRLDLDSDSDSDPDNGPELDDSPDLPGWQPPHDEPKPEAAPVPTPRPQRTPTGNKVADAIRDAIEDALGNVAQPLDETRIVELIHEHSHKPKVLTLEIKRPDAPPVKIERAHIKLARVVRHLAAGRHVALIGPAGCGKTHLAAQAAEAIGRPFSFCGALQGKHELLGYRDAMGNYQSTPFRRAFQDGQVFLFDEIDAGSPSVPLAVNAQLANGHGDFPDGMIPRHDGFVCMVAANTFGRGADREYVGRTQLDAATIDRFAFVEVDYDEGLEHELGPHREWTARVHKIRHAVREQKVRLVVSMRAVIFGGQAILDGDSWQEAEESFIWRGLDADTRRKVLEAC